MATQFYKVSKRREMDISTVAACFVVRLTASGTIAHARLAFGGVAAMPLRARETERALIGKNFESTCRWFCRFSNANSRPYPMCVAAPVTARN